MLLFPHIPLPLDKGNEGSGNEIGSGRENDALRNIGGIAHNWLTNTASFTCAHFDCVKKQTKWILRRNHRNHRTKTRDSSYATQFLQYYIRVRLSLCREWGRELEGKGGGILDLDQSCDQN